MIELKAENEDLHHNCEVLEECGLSREEKTLGQCQWNWRLEGVGWIVTP